jgi:peptidoglycan/LPS O-acetylase OafA/YrhL
MIGMMVLEFKTGGTKKYIYMWIAFAIMFIITALISWLWVRGIDNQMKYQKQNPDHNPSEGWLDWDDNKATTEGGL